MAYLNDSQMVSRSQNTAIEMPERVANDVVKAAASESVVMRLARKVPMTSKKSRQPLIAGLPEAYWVDGDTGLKQTTTVKFDGVELTAEALATLVIVPDEFFDDSQIPIWEEVKPLVAEAMGRKIDNAALFGVNKPASWNTSVYASAAAAGNYVERPVSNPDDFGKLVADAAKLVVADGFSVNAFAVRNGLKWDLLGERDANGGPLFTTLVGEDGGDGLYGLPAVESTNGAWDQDVSVIAGDWNKALLGVRQDVTYTVHTDAVVTDNNGAVIFNAMQQDSKILRVVMRVGFGIANPATYQNTTTARSPFALVAADNTVGS
ncbi:HK97 family phage major capsid protein [Micromonospora sp. HB375]|uniref:phage major capsid protein n=1 Tax=unclassified Micromonospora TaxID=2617518 RepID=UPI001AE46234|nr:MULTISPECIES: phage major capsid protein [unclassified Micromonospora]MBP1782657.1 HK97 family phage major capsid protein [Micromonospora sp. HB375]MDH6468520.1 HK97 family phage major capsid protein [Micromonospora sp. H404/HB375]